MARKPYLIQTVKLTLYPFRQAPYSLLTGENMDGLASLRNLKGKILKDSILDYYNYTTIENIERENFDGSLA